MTRITVVDRDGEEHTVDAEDDAPLMHTLRELDYGVAAICMGMCSCGTCHVYVDSEWLDRLEPPNPDEEDLLCALRYHKPNSRLSCQLECTPKLDGLRIRLAPEE